MKLPITLLALALSTAAVADAPKTVDDALAQARKTHQPAFLDFSAPWCYSCYFMMTHVLNGPEFEKLESRAVVAEIDADSPDG
ncbi:MAG TPA: thioredoxin family protein, partial [Rhodanobacteraceae bacterium]|nr:thioredoxin family protein [Rhodanobacteraceae bacterium]